MERTADSIGVEVREILLPGLSGNIENKDGSICAHVPAAYVKMGKMQ